MKRVGLSALAGALWLAGAAGCEEIIDLRDPVLDTTETTSSETTTSGSTTSGATTTDSTGSTTDTTDPNESCAPFGIELAPAFQGMYQCRQIGPLGAMGEQVPTGGMAFDPGGSDTLLVLADDALESAHLRKVTLKRDPEGHIQGIAARDDHHADLPYAAAITFGPDGTLYYTLPGTGSLGQRATLGGPEKLIDLVAEGVEDNVGHLAFIPNGVPGGGRLAISSTSPNGSVGDVHAHLYTFVLGGGAPGDHGLGAPAASVDLLLFSGGIAYISAGNPGIDAASLVVADIATGVLSLHATDAQGIPAFTGEPFVTFVDELENPLHNLGPWGVTVDPVSGDVLFVHWAEVRLFAVRGLSPP
ncbi:MAG: hypothetical protein R3B70_37150 [Polyangiaceae bacterium]